MVTEITWTEATRLCLSVCRDPRRESILRRRFGIGSEPETLEEIGKSLGVTRERVRQLEVAALWGLIETEVVGVTVWLGTIGGGLGGGEYRLFRALVELGEGQMVEWCRYKAAVGTREGRAYERGRRWVMGETADGAILSYERLIGVVYAPVPRRNYLGAL